MWMIAQDNKSALRTHHQTSVSIMMGWINEVIDLRQICVRSCCTGKLCMATVNVISDGQFLFECCFVNHC